MSAPEPTTRRTATPAGGLLVLVDPQARRLDGESVRIARDVLSAGAAAKICLPEGPEEFARALARRGSRRPVIVGDDRALVRAVSLLHQGRELAAGELSLVPVGPPTALSLAHGLGVPVGAVAAARAVLAGRPRPCDLLVDDSDNIVLRALRIVPGAPAVPAGRFPAGAGGAPGAQAVGPTLWSACRSLVRTLVRPPVTGRTGPAGHRLRVEVDGTLLVDVDRPVEALTVATAPSDSERAGLAEVVILTSDGQVRARARTVTVSGADFRYRADEAPTGPVRRRTWTLRPSGWNLTLPS
ncbi:diacylglycerol kinase [Streptomyces sp. BI20]|uniref:diacylglycerol kinase n=1 Tax=Streptomyces sp. BI20 TaxID=3403460 RepID=UPI003C76F105